MTLKSDTIIMGCIIVEILCLISIPLMLAWVLA